MEPASAQRYIELQTCDSQIDPSSVGIGVVSALKEDDGALVPALIAGSDAADLDGRVVE